MLITFIILLFFHFLADYPLQGDFLAKAKNKYNPIPGIPWRHAMFAHCFIHGFFVFLMTGMFTFLIGEIIIHWITDQLKCKGVIDYSSDQLIHIATKMIWAYLSVSIPVASLITQTSLLQV